MNRIYELVLVMKTSLSEADRKKLIDGIKDDLKDMKISKEDDWGQKPLAYPIKKESAGVYHIVHFEGEKAVPQDLETKLLRNADVLRHLLLRTK